MIVVEIVYNLSLLLVSGIISDFTAKKFNKCLLIGKILQGITFGVIAVLAMLNPFVLAKGIIFDGRSILISLSTLFFGPISGIITTLFALVARIIIGGDGLIVGVSVIISSFLCGYLFYFLVQKKIIAINNAILYLFGLLVHIIMLFLMIFLPKNFAWVTFKVLGITIITIYPLITLLLGKILYDQLQNEELSNKLSENEEKLAYFIQNSPLAVIERDKDGKITFWNKEAEKVFEYSADEVIGKTEYEINLIYEEDKDLVKNLINNIYNSKNVYFVNTNRNVTKSGKIKYCEWYKTIRKNNKGEVLNSISLVLDITERKKTETALINNERKLNDIITFLPDATFAIDTNHKIILWNKAMEDITGLKAEEMIGDYSYRYAVPFYGIERPMLLDLITTKDNKIKGLYKNLIEQGDLFITTVFCSNFNDGKGGWFFSKASPLYDSDGRIIGAIESLRDITEQKLRDEQKKERIEKVNQLQEVLLESAASEFLISGNVKLFVNYLTEKIGKLLKVERTSVWFFNDEYTKLECSNLYEFSKNYHSKDVTLNYHEFKDEFEALKRSKYIDANEPLNDNRTKGYKNYLLNNNITSMLDAVIRISNKVYGVICLEHVNKKHIWNFDEISFLCQVADQISIAIANKQKKLIEKSLIKMQMAVENSKISIIITDANGKIEYINPYYSNISGFDANELIGLLPNEFREDCFKEKDEFNKIKEQIELGNDFEFIFENTKKNGERYFENVKISVFKNEDNEISNFLILKEDITEKLKLENVLKEALRQSEEMNKLKSNLLANINHEIRTPLNGILGFAEILSQELTKPVQKNMALTILHSSKRLSETLNLILDLSIIESDRISYKKEKTDIINLTKKIIETYDDEAIKKGIELELKVNNYELYADIDENLFKRALLNVVDNAIKYTKKGKVVIELGLLKENGTNNIYIKIMDTGIGITSEKISIIWDAFRQVSEGLNRDYQGLGLGLTIAKKVINLMGGTIDVKSKLGVGSEFLIKLPIFGGEGLVNETKFDINVNKENINIFENIDNTTKELKKLLYVEDEPINRNIIKLFLKNLYNVYTVADGESALDIVKNEKFDIILMDINLGVGLSGLEVTKEIRKMEEYKNLPIIAVTAYTSDKDKQEFLEAGCTSYIFKPFDKNSLIELISKFI